MTTPLFRSVGLQVLPKIVKPAIPCCSAAYSALLLPRIAEFSVRCSCYAVKMHQQTFSPTRKSKIFHQGSQKRINLLRRVERLVFQRESPSHMRMSDRHGRTSWLARQILPHEPALRSWLRKRMGDAFDIDDVVQEAYTKLVRLETVEHISNPKAYLFQTATSIILQEIRRAQIVAIDSMEQLERLEIEAADPGPDCIAESREELKMVAGAIEDLPAKCRAVFVLRKVHGLSQREIAEHLNISEKTVEKHIGRAIQKLMSTFGRGGKSDAPASNDRKMSGLGHATTGNKR